MKFTQEQIAKGIDLLNKIRTDEGEVFTECVNDTRDFCTIKFFDDGDSTGIFFSLLYYGSLRIFIVFEEDTDNYVQELSVLILATAEQNPDYLPRVYFREENKKLIEKLRETITFQPPYPNGFYYTSHEFVMDREHFKGYINDRGLDVRPYADDRLEDYLLLLDSAMTFASPPPNFRGNRENMRGELTKKVFRSFYKDQRLAGLYWLDNDFVTIQFLAVSSEYQWQGYGSVILSHAIHTVLSDPKHEMAKLYCVDWNAKGLNFYKKFGMIPKGHMLMMIVETSKKGVEK